MINRNCLVCNKEFKAKPYLLKRGFGKFCGSKCMGKWYSKIRKGKNNQNWHNAKREVQCLRCGNIFIVFLCNMKQRRGIFCSRSCASKWRTQNFHGEKSPNWKEKIKLKCQMCRKQFQVIPSLKNKRKFCSRSCMMKYRNINNIGKNNPNWKGGISFEPYCLIFSNKEFKQIILERDNYHCQNPYCNNGHKNLCIHHINYDKKDCNLQNLITLCRPHNSQANYNREWHKTFYKTIIEHKG